jgi:phenylpropionate dioxygenase-like ring-hydroxylating dioxygenase large terminal subunit
MNTTTRLADDPTVVQRILDHIDNKTTDLGESTWREPVENYRSEARFAAERELVLRRYPVAFCPSAALPETGSYVARPAAGTPIVVVRGSDAKVRAFRNACRHRGTQLADGAGCEKALVCRYHGWTYGLDGRLRHVPHEHGFPGLDKSARGLVPLETVEQSGIVFVTQGGPPVAEAHPGELPPLIPPSYRLVDTNEREIPANWKILVEGFLEGYHIRSTHAQTFYPVQFDNLNVVEEFGNNSRVAYPYRAINKLRDVPPASRSADGKLTYVYHLFPNAMVATFPGRIVMVAIEPLATDRTRFVTYTLTDRRDADARAALKQGADLVAAGAAEDQYVACAIQRSLASGANDLFEFGLFEGAIVHFHRVLRAAIDGAAWESEACPERRRRALSEPHGLR